MNEPITIGRYARAKRNIGDSRNTLPYIFAGEEVLIVSQPMITNGEGTRSLGYIICNRDGLHVIAQASDITFEPVPPPKTVEQRVAEAFQEGYSRGHSRGLTCGKLYGGDDQYRTIISVETQGYLRELRGDDEYDY